MKIQNATALVTGANRGIGYAFVNALLQAGASKVYATARDINSLKAVTELDANRVIPLQLDVIDQNLVNASATAAPDVNLLINNAGAFTFGNILDVPTEAIASQFNTNFYGSLNMARVCSLSKKISFPIPCLLNSTQHGSKIIKPLKNNSLRCKLRIGSNCDEAQFKDLVLTPYPNG
jgi:NAD(P)-dependent dehydrogenase (short-subunit alcohol dehydrogenase family)